MPSSTQCRTYAVTAESYPEIRAHSTLPNPIRGRATGITGTIVANVENGQLLLDPMPSMQVVIPIAKLSSGNEFQDREVRKLISGPTSPNILAELRRAQPGARPDVYLMQGAITIKGSKQDTTPKSPSASAATASRSTARRRWTSASSASSRRAS
jgi:hypothetical protein